MSYALKPEANPMIHRNHATASSVSQNISYPAGIVRLLFTTRGYRINNSEANTGHPARFPYTHLASVLSTFSYDFLPNGLFLKLFNSHLHQFSDERASIHDRVISNVHIIFVTSYSRTPPKRMQIQRYGS
jgi:hypothetical protein